MYMHNNNTVGDPYWPHPFV